MLYPIYPQPYGSVLSVEVKYGFWSTRFLFPGGAGLLFARWRSSSSGLRFGIGSRWLRADAALHFMTNFVFGEVRGRMSADATYQMG
jgi:hypothetical protein